MNPKSGAVSAYMTPEEVAEFYRIPVGTLYGWRYKGTGPKVSKMGRHLRYKRSDVEAWAEQQSEAR